MRLAISLNRSAGIAAFLLLGVIAPGDRVDAAAAFLRTPPSSPSGHYLLDWAPWPPMLEAMPEQPEGPLPWAPAEEVVVAGVLATWPEDAARALRILYCESKAGQHQDTYDLEAENGGPMQINRYTWAWYFEARFGWHWEMVVTDLDVHLRAARHIYDLAGGWSPWGCY